MTQLQEVLEKYALTVPLGNTPKNTAITEMRPWGFFTVLEERAGYNTKLNGVKGR